MSQKGKITEEPVIIKHYFNNGYNRTYTNSNKATERTKMTLNARKFLMNLRLSDDNLVETLLKNKDTKLISKSTGSDSKVYVLSINNNKIIMKLNPTRRAIAQNEYNMYKIYNA